MSFSRRASSCTLFSIRLIEETAAVGVSFTFLPCTFSPYFYFCFHIITTWNPLVYFLPGKYKLTNPSMSPSDEFCLGKFLVCHLQLFVLCLRFRNPSLLCSSFLLSVVLEIFLVSQQSSTPFLLSLEDFLQKMNQTKAFSRTASQDSLSMSKRVEIKKFIHAHSSSPLAGLSQAIA